MSLANHLRIGTPLIWCETQEPRRLIDSLLTYTDRLVYRMDPIDGFVRYDPETARWTVVLIEVIDEDSGDPMLVPTRDLGDAMRHVFFERALFVMEYAHQVAEQIIPFLSNLSRDYAEAVFADDHGALPAQFVLLSHDSAKLPPEIIREAVRVDYDLPTFAELTEITTYYATQAEVDLSDTKRTALARAALGMSEAEYLNTLARGLAEDKTFDEVRVNRAKIDNLKRDGILEVRTPQLSFADIGGLDQAKELMRRAAWIQNHPEEANRFYLEALRRILLVGVQGTGKSALCEAVAKELGLDLVQFGASKLMSKWVGESEANTRRAFKQIRAMAPCVLWVDEFGRDMSGGQSSGEVDSGTTDRVHGEMLQGIQELPANVFLVCAANNVSALPPEVLRADRFDQILFVGFPTARERRLILAIHLKDHAENYDLDLLAKATPFFTGAELKALIKETRFRIVGDHQRMPTTEDFVKYAAHQKGRIWINFRAQILEMYKRGKKEWNWASSEQEAEADYVIDEKVPGTNRSEKPGKVDMDSLYRKANAT